MYYLRICVVVVWSQGAYIIILETATSCMHIPDTCVLVMQYDAYVVFGLFYNRLGVEIISEDRQIACLTCHFMRWHD